MRKSVPFKLNHGGVLLALISAAFAGEAAAAAAHVDFTYGGVTVAGRDGVARPLARGAELDSGDTVRTGEGRAQLRFTDGAYVSLQPNTEFAIREYRFDGKTDGSETGFFSLLKGAMRTVTGLIGHVNRNRYQITTPTATVGIRGTGGVIQVQNDGSTLIIGTSGIWSLSNPAGSIDVPAGTSALAPSAPGTPPQETSEQPQAGPPLPVTGLLPPVVAGEQPLVTVLQTGPGYTAAIAFGAPSANGTFAQLDGGEGAFFSGAPTTNATFNSTGQLTSLGNFSNSGSWTLGPGGTNADFGTDGILAWGRWVGPVTTSSFGSFTIGPDEGFHYVVGTPTVTMPTSGFATYDLMGATSPTYVGGLTAPGKVTSGQLQVNFTSGSYDISLVNFGVSMPSATYRLDGSSTIFSSGPYFVINPSITGCSSVCSSQVNGFFAGASAERAGISYQISDTGRSLIGAAAFKQTSIGPAPILPALR